MKSSASIGLCACGLFAPLVYVLTVYLGGSWRRNDYSHVARAISELTERNAPNKSTLDRLFLLYNALAILGATGFYLAVNTLGSVWLAGAACLLTTTCISVLMSVFPMDPISKEPVPMSAAGKIHIVDAGLTALFTMISMGLLGSAGLTNALTFGYGAFSLSFLVFQILSGAASATAAARLHPWMGLAERVTIGIYLLWLFVSFSLVVSSYFPSYS